MTEPKKALRPSDRRLERTCRICTQPIKDSNISGYCRPCFSRKDKAPRKRGSDYSRGLKCLTCGKALYNLNKTDYCKLHVPERFKGQDLMWD